MDKKTLNKLHEYKLRKPDINYFAILGHIYCAFAMFSFWYNQYVLGSVFFMMGLYHFTFMIKYYFDIRKLIKEILKK